MAGDADLVVVVDATPFAAGQQPVVVREVSTGPHREGQRRPQPRVDLHQLELAGLVVAEELDHREAVPLQFVQQRAARRVEFGDRHRLPEGAGAAGVVVRPELAVLERRDGLALVVQREEAVLVGGRQELLDDGGVAVAPSDRLHVGSVTVEVLGRRGILEVLGAVVVDVGVGQQGVAAFDDPLAVPAVDLVEQVGLWDGDAGPPGGFDEFDTVLGPPEAIGGRPEGLDVRFELLAVAREGVDVLLADGEDGQHVGPHRERQERVLVGDQVLGRVGDDDGLAGVPRMEGGGVRVLRGHDGVDSPLPERAHAGDAARRGDGRDDYRRLRRVCIDAHLHTAWRSPPVSIDRWTRGRRCLPVEPSDLRRGRNQRSPAVRPRSRRRCAPTGRPRVRPRSRRGSRPAGRRSGHR